MTQETNDVVERILADIAREEADSGGPDDGNPWHTFTTRISDVKALLAELQSQSALIAELEGLLLELVDAVEAVRINGFPTKGLNRMLEAKTNARNALTKDSTSGPVSDPISNKGER